MVADRAAALVIVAAFLGAALAMVCGFPAINVSLSGLAIAATVIDWGQTRHIARNPARFYEKNPILGRSPSVRRVNVYFGVCLLGGVAIALALPDLFCAAFLVVISAIELSVAVLNWRLGIEVDL